MLNPELVRQSKSPDGQFENQVSADWKLTASLQVLTTPENMTAWNQNQGSHPKIVGLLPAGGKAKRIAPLPCSKELFPVGFQNLRQDLGVRPKVVSHYLSEKMRLAGVTKVHIVLRKGKWDIPAYFGLILFRHLESWLQ